MTEKDHRMRTGSKSAEAGNGTPLTVSSDALLQDRTEILIEHNGECYRLRRTRQDKLILTK